MLYHKDCGGHVVFDTTLVIVSEVNLTKDGIRLTGGTIRNANNNISLKCQCGKQVPASEIIAPCMNCGEVLPLDKLFIPHETQGMYCKKNGCFDAVANGQRAYSAATATNKLVNN